MPISDNDGIECRCADCGRPFRLVGDDPKPGQAYLAIRSCDSGGIYAVRIECPHCGHEHDLY
jgi:DNA-directed RNA polymerase subunit RPC12/RpoP